MTMATHPSAAVDQGGPMHKHGGGRAGSSHCPGCQISLTGILLQARGVALIAAPSAPMGYARVTALTSLTPERDLRPPIFRASS